MHSATSSLFTRALQWQKLQAETVWDVLVIGGGATGLGTAVDAASRGFATVLVEKNDFAKSTSSRSTKLVHGGVRYLAQGNLSLVYSALRERGVMLQQAPHLVTKQAFVIPCYSYFEYVKYGIGLKLYDAMAGKWGFEKTVWLNKSEVIEKLPGVQQKGLVGGVLYYDGQFDDARFAVNLAQTAAEQGAIVLNYAEVIAFIKKDERVCGVKLQDAITGETKELFAKAVINATGIYADVLAKLDTPEAAPLLQHSQGAHLVFSKRSLPLNAAIMIPETSDGRVLFAIPWKESVVVGTTDTPVKKISDEPDALNNEAHFILETLNRFVEEPLSLHDVQTVFTGLRPLVLPDAKKATKEIARDHKIVVSESGMITILGGKWTTYRKMAEDVLDKAISVHHLEKKACVTQALPLHGFLKNLRTGHLKIYGADAPGIEALQQQIPELKTKLHPDYPYTEAEVIWAAQHEMAMTVEDILARRIRLLFLNAHAALKAAPRVALLLRDALGKDAQWEQEQLQQFEAVAQHYICKTEKSYVNKQLQTF